MAHPVVVTVRSTFALEGRLRAVGTVLAMDPVQAAILHRQGAVWLRGTLPVEPIDDVPVRKRRSYRRRDLTAEVEG